MREEFGEKSGDIAKMDRTTDSNPWIAVSAPAESSRGRDTVEGDRHEGGDMIRAIMNDSGLIPMHIVDEKVQPLDDAEDSDSSSSSSSSSSDSSSSDSSSDSDYSPAASSDEPLSDDESYLPFRDRKICDLCEGCKIDEETGSEQEAMQNSPKVEPEDTIYQLKYKAMGAKPKVYSSPKGKKRKLSSQLENETVNTEPGKRRSPCRSRGPVIPNCCCVLCKWPQFSQRDSVVETAVTWDHSYAKTRQNESDIPHHRISAEKGLDSSIPVATAEQVKTAIANALKSCHLSPQESERNPSNTKEEMVASFSSAVDFLMPSTSAGTRRVFNANAEKSRDFHKLEVSIPFTLGDESPIDLNENPAYNLQGNLNFIIPKLQPRLARQEGENVYKSFTLPDVTKDPLFEDISPPSINPFKGYDLYFNSARQTRKIDRDLVAKSTAVRKLDFGEPSGISDHEVAMTLLNRTAVKKASNRRTVKKTSNVNMSNQSGSETGEMSRNMWKQAVMSVAHESEESQVNLPGKAVKLETEKGSHYKIVESLEKYLSETLIDLFEKSDEVDSDVIKENLSNRNIVEGLEEIKDSLESLVNGAVENIYELSKAAESKNCKVDQPNKAVGLVSDNNSENQLNTDAGKPADNHNYNQLNLTFGHPLKNHADDELGEIITHRSDNQTVIKFNKTAGHKSNSHEDNQTVIKFCKTAGHKSNSHEHNQTVIKFNKTAGRKSNSHEHNQTDETVAYPSDNHVNEQLKGIVKHSSDAHTNNQVNQATGYPSGAAEDQLSETVGDATDAHVEDQLKTDGQLEQAGESSSHITDALKYLTFTEAEGSREPVTEMEANAEEDMGCEVCGHQTMSMCGRKRVCGDCREFFKECVLEWDWRKYLIQNCRAMPDHPAVCRWCIFRKCLRAGLLTQTVIDENAKMVAAKEARVSAVFATITRKDLAQELWYAYHTTFEKTILDDTVDLQSTLVGCRGKLVQFFFNVLGTTYIKLRQFSNKIPGFMELDVDRIYLVNSATLELFLIQIFFNDMFTQNMVILPDGTLARISDLFKAFPEMLPEVKHFGNLLKKTKFDFYTTVLLRSVVLLTDRTGLQEPQLVRKLYKKVMDLLRHHIKDNYDPNISDDYLIDLLIYLGMLRAIAAKLFMYIRSVAYHVKVPLPDYIVKLHQHR